MTAEPGEPQDPPPTGKGGPGFIFVTLLLDVIGLGILIPVLPEIVADLTGGDASTAARYYGPIVALYAMMQVLFAPLLGSLSDRFGRRVVILVSLTGMAISYLILGLAPSITWLFVGRGLAGITGATITTANAYMADVSTPETRSRNFGLVGAAFGIGFVLGPALGGLLGEIGPRVPFFGAALVVALNVVWGLFILPESLPPDKRRPFELTDANPLASLRHLRIHPLVTSLAVAFFLFSVSQRSLESVWVLHAKFRYGWSEWQNGLSLAGFGVAAAIVQGLLVRRIVGRLGEPRTLLLGLSLQAVSQVLFAAAATGVLLLMVIPVAALGAISGPALQGLVTSVVPEDRQGAVQGALAAVQSLTTIVAPLASTWIFAAATDGTLPFIMPGLPFLLASGFTLLAIGAAASAVSRYAE
ncbi:MAG: TCR/Tet family MFS transporter [Myxococcota bacterium]